VTSPTSPPGCNRPRSRHRVGGPGDAGGDPSVHRLPGPRGYLDLQWYGDECDLVDRFDYYDGTRSVSVDLYQNCGAEGSVFTVIAAQPADLTYLLYAEVVW
jgi:hypothetical protein